MTKKQWTPEERKAFGAKMRALKEAKKQAAPTPELPEDLETHVAGEQDLNDLKRQMQEVMETNALLKAALLGGQANQQPNASIGVNSGGRLLGEVEKYLVDPANYPDPTSRLAQEARLKPLAFDYNYEMDYEVAVSSYETKTGVNTKEPKFTITLNRIKLDDQGGQTDQRYIARRMVFHEDPQAAVVIARDNGIEIDSQADEKTFLNEMRYLRVRDWLFDIFWPQPVNPSKQIREEVIGGTIVQVFTKSSLDPSEIDFNQLNTKIQA